jgi:hypothetical protein
MCLSLSKAVGRKQFLGGFYNCPPMCSTARAVCVAFLLLGIASAGPRSHTIGFGKFQRVRVPSDRGETQTARIRGLFIDAYLKEYTAGPMHEVTERLFVVRRAFRLNDSLPGDKGRGARWIWTLGNWISVDRSTGHITQLALPEFDPELSQASWYRDYAAYCGASDDGSKMYLIVAQLGKRKPVLKRESQGQCGLPEWERRPMRVTFSGAEGKATFLVHSRGAELEEARQNGEGPE